jgi:signal transduction histidine kinase
MKTPLAAINGTADYALTKLKGGVWDAELDGSLETIMERSDDLTVYVTRLLNQAVEQENKLDFAAVPITPLLDRAAGMMEPILRERGNRLTLSVDGKLPPLSGVEDMLLRVLLNLISNASRHSEGSEITITASPAADPMAEGMAVIRVTDRGGGIPEELMPRIFYRGMSGDGSSGLGLTICKDIVETHGGEIKISSELGNGTEVWFTVPFAKE